MVAVCIERMDMKDKGKVAPIHLYSLLGHVSTTTTTTTISRRAACVKIVAKVGQPDCHHTTTAIARECQN